MRRRRVNFNSDAIVATDGFSERMETRSRSVFDAAVSVHFDKIEDVLEREIRSAAGVFGVVAWLTNERLLSALSSCGTISIVVQKEDFLRPDRAGTGPAWRQRVRDMYGALPVGYRPELPGSAGDLSIARDMECDAVRCAGMTGQFAPRVHHKFAVFCDFDHDTPPETCAERERWKPYAVATGSFNWTSNATASRENVVIIRDPEIATAYLEEWAAVLAISEPLDWEHEYVAPQWRIGT